MEAQRKRIIIIVRTRPLLHEEVSEDSRAKYIAIKVNPSGKKLTLVKEATVDRDFEFDGVAYYKSTTQESFYQQYCEPSIQNMFNGYNTTFIVYGPVILNKDFVG